ncbi:hypothetical protein J2T18_001022 [Paenibacillus polymyxa]|uniref:hypothetical protein n=1 Tax=Paenibacillus polymyxa TaxID=1406 RepID=UPI002790F35C|nr:hypothetical protein [Paenibacillus polymyxa]MDQ0046750.1 hypothetical protein [Paenibacillus polymyxa]
MNSNDFSWKEVYSYWKHFIEEYSYRSIDELSFKKIKIQPQLNPNLNIGTEIIDWWPTNEVEYRTKKLNDRGILGADWDTVVGFNRTAEMLWNNKESNEQQALIWIAAGLNEILSHLPEEWRGDPYRFIYETKLNIMKEFKNRDMCSWHGSTRNFLPVTVNKFMELYSKPMEIYNLMNIIAIDNVFSRNAWTLVCVSREEDDSV